MAVIHGEGQSGRETCVWSSDNVLGRWQIFRDLINWGGEVSTSLSKMTEREREERGQEGMLRGPHM